MPLFTKAPAKFAGGLFPATLQPPTTARRGGRSYPSRLVALFQSHSDAALPLN
jgi:hypothetical protein